MDPLISTDAARRHLRLSASDMTVADTAADVADKAKDATGIIIDYLKRPDHGWTVETVPFPVKAAILLVLTALFEDREGQQDPISDAVKSLLARLRDPAVA